jgi:hypothetical protein
METRHRLARRGRDVPAANSGSKARLAKRAVACCAIGAAAVAVSAALAGVGVPVGASLVTLIAAAVAVVTLSTAMVNHSAASLNHRAARLNLARAEVEYATARSSERRAALELESAQTRVNGGVQMTFDGSREARQGAAHCSRCRAERGPTPP